MNIAHIMVKGGIVVAIVVPLLFGCSAPPSTNSEDTPMVYVEPGWMAESRQKQEREAADMVACLAEAGWTARVSETWGVEHVGNLGDDQLQMYDEASTTCAQSLFGGAVARRTEAEWRVKYDQALDTRDCLVAHGYTISDPPSEDSWVQTGLAGGSPWAPWNSVVDQFEAGIIDLDRQQYTELFVACPQAGPTISMGGAF